MVDSVALVGVAGGVGTTRLAVETAATLARAGEDVAVVDAALDSQGLSRYVEGRIDPDLTSVLADEAALSDAGVSVWPELTGDATVYPAHAPFERIARAKTPEAGERLEGVLDHAARGGTRVIVDVGPLGDNPGVGAVTAADRRALVASDDRRGADLLPRMRGRLVDVGAEPDAVVRTDLGPGGEGPTDPDVAVPHGPAAVTHPSVIEPDETFAPAVATVAATLFDADIDIETESESLLS